MTCWDILGIEPTGDLERIREAYERQMKFASADEASALERAFREATGDVPPEQESPQRNAHSDGSDQETEQVDVDGEQELDASEAQIAREVVVQIKALMNDDQRQQDAGIWKAILCEPPADQPALKREIGRQLEPRIRPMAENGAFPRNVSQFLGEWFAWSGVRDALQGADHRNAEPAHGDDPRNFPEPGMSSDRDPADEPPQMVNFWPAVIGWIVGLVILATIFGGMGG